jgi:hemerythrin
MSHRFEPITCTENLKTGIAGIDEEHLILVNMLNMAGEQLTDSSSRMQLQDIVRDLMSYALYHFDNEEELMQENAYPAEDMEKHFMEHRNFSATVAQLQQDISQGKLVSRDELLGFLKTWLLNHILGTDKRLGVFLANLDPASSQA